LQEVENLITSEELVQVVRMIPAGNDGNYRQDDVLDQEELVGIVADEKPASEC